MAYKYQGDSVLSVSLTVDTPKPLDTRMVVANSEELYTIPAKSAYLGMPVVNASNGNIYVLVDKSNIDNKTGWKASYESIQIITCTKEEYDVWAHNTDDNYQPIDESQPWLHEDTYYYIDEESIKDGLLLNDQYLTRSWGEGIEGRLVLKADKTQVDNINTSLTSLITRIDENYITEETISNTYVLQTALNELIEQYYTKIQTDTLLNDYVKKSDLEGEFEGEGYAFVTLKQYSDDMEEINEILDQTLKTNEDGSLNSLKVDEIKSKQQDVVINLQNGKAKLNNKELAVIDDIPIIIPLSKQEYDELVENNNVQEDAYYYIYDIENNNLVYVTYDYLTQYFYTKTVIDGTISHYYTKTQIDNILNNYQSGGDYALKTDLDDYYTKTQIQESYSTSSDIADTYATKEELEELSEDISENYVTKADLKGGSTEDTDFVFVTKTEYTLDKEAQAKQISTLKVKVGNIEISESEGKLKFGTKDAAITDDIPVIVPISQTNYNQLIADDEIDEETYYYIYDEGNPDLAYVTKSEFEQLKTNTNNAIALKAAKSELNNKIDKPIPTEDGTFKYQLVVTKNGDEITYSWELIPENA